MGVLITFSDSSSSEQVSSRSGYIDVQAYNKIIIYMQEEITLRYALLFSACNAKHLYFMPNSEIYQPEQ